jgi:hypothetical protein
VWFSEAAIAAWKPSHQPRAAASALLGVGDSDGADAVGGFPLGARQTERRCQRHPVL